MKITFIKKLQLNFCLSLAILMANAQEPLRVGMQMPDMRINKIINHSSASLSTEQFKGKAVLLYFWSTWCSSCISSMPKLQALQEKFNDRLQILMITAEDSIKIEKLYKKREYLKNLRLPLVLSDTVLTKIFPHEDVPHIVWINGQQKVCAITDGSELTEPVIELFINGVPVNLENKSYTSVNSEKTNLKSIAGDDNLLISSCLTKSIKSITGGMGVYKQENCRIKITAINRPIIDMYAFACRKVIKLLPQEYDDRVLLSVRNKSRFLIPDDPKKFLSAGYCYELVVDAAEGNITENDCLEFMQEDLDRYFGVKSKVEKTNIPCYVIKYRGSVNIKKSDTAYIKYYQNEIDFINQHPSKILPYLNKYGDFKKPLIFEGDSEVRISIRLKQSKMSFEEIRELLSQCELSLTIGNREINVLVITDL